MSTLSTDGSYAVPISGPSERLAWLRALWLKVQGIARTAWAHARVVLSGAIQLPRWVANATLSLLSSKAGYDTVVSAIGTGVRAVGRGVGWALSRLGRGLSWLGDTAARLAGRVWPAAETWLRGTTARVAAPVRNAIEWLGSGLLTGAGTVAEGLARTPLVRAASTTGAKVAAGILAVHAVSKGAVAARIVAALPASMDLVIAATNPWVALAGVGVVTLAAMGIALARLLAAGIDDGPDDGGAQPVSGAAAAAVGDVLTDLAEIAKTVHVVIGPTAQSWSRAPPRPSPRTCARSSPASPPTPPSGTWSGRCGCGRHRRGMTGGSSPRRREKRSSPRPSGVGRGRSVKPPDRQPGPSRQWGGPSSARFVLSGSARGPLGGPSPPPVRRAMDTTGVGTRPRRSTSNTTSAAHARQNSRSCSVGPPFALASLRQPCRVLANACSSSGNSGTSSSASFCSSHSSMVGNSQSASSWSSRSPRHCHASGWSNISASCANSLSGCSSAWFRRTCSGSARLVETHPDGSQLSASSFALNDVVSLAAS